MKRLFLPIVIYALFMLIGCGGEGGVRVGETMEQYAIEYIERSNLLLPNETIEAYYDYTILLDATEGAILTDSRIIHYVHTHSTAFYLYEITEINHYTKSIEGLFIEVFRGSEMMLIEIAYLNGGNIFLNLLQKKTDL